MGVVEEEKKERALEERGMLDPLVRFQKQWQKHRNKGRILEARAEIQKQGQKPIPSSGCEPFPLPKRGNNLKGIEDFHLSIRCILGDTRLCAGDTSTSSCRV